MTFVKICKMVSTNNSSYGDLGMRIVAVFRQQWRRWSNQYTIEIVTSTIMMRWKWVRMMGKRRNRDVESDSGECMRKMITNMVKRVLVLIGDKWGKRVWNEKYCHLGRRLCVLCGWTHDNVAKNELECLHANFSRELQISFFLYQPFLDLLWYYT